MSEKLVELEGEMRVETPAAYLFANENQPDGVWIPKSLCEWDWSDETMTMFDWLAVEKGLI